MKKLAALMALLMSLSCLTACDLSALLGGGTSGENSSTSENNVEGEKSLEVLGQQEVVTLKKDESKEADSLICALFRDFASAFEKNC